MENLGEFFGTLTAFSFTLALLNYVSKWINKNWVNKLSKDSKIRKYYLSLMKFIIKNHRLFGLAALCSVLIHLYIQITFKWVSTTGLIAAGMMIITVVLGISLFYLSKNKRGLLFKIHRLAVVLLMIAVAAHLLIKI